MLGVETGVAHPLFLEAKHIEFSSLHFTLFGFVFLDRLCIQVETGVARSAARGFCDPSACKYVWVCLRFSGICRLWFGNIMWIFL